MSLYRNLLAIICTLFALQIGAVCQKQPRPVNVVNTPGVVVTNSSIQVAGTVTVENLPFDANGNLRTSAAQKVPQYEFSHIVYSVCQPVASVHDYDLCPMGGRTEPIDSKLNNLSKEGWDVLAVSPYSVTYPGSNTTIISGVIYTLRRPVL